VKVERSKLDGPARVSSVNRRHLSRRSAARQAITSLRGCHAAEARNNNNADDCGSGNNSATSAELMSFILHAAGLLHCC